MLVHIEITEGGLWPRRRLRSARILGATALRQRAANIVERTARALVRARLLPATVITPNVLLARRLVRRDKPYQSRRGFLGAGLRCSTYAQYSFPGIFRTSAAWRSAQCLASSTDANSQLGLRSTLPVI